MLLETLQKPSKQFLVQSDVLLVYPKRDVQVSYSHLWMQAGRAVSSAYTLPKWEPSLMFTTFLDASAPILGHHQTRARARLLWCKPSTLPPPALSGRATTGDLHARRFHTGFSFMTWCYPGSLGRAAGAVEPGLCGCCYGAGHSYHWFPKPLLQTLGERNCSHGALPAPFITSHSTIPTPSRPCRSHSHFSWQMGCLVLNYQQLVVNTAKESCNYFLFFLFFLFLSRFKLGAPHACSWQGQRGRQKGGKGRGSGNICFTFNLEPNFFIVLLQPRLYIDSITRLC